MKLYLGQLNNKIDSLVTALKNAEKLISRQTSKKSLDENIAAIAKMNDLNGISIAESFQNDLKAVPEKNKWVNNLIP